MVNLLNFSEFYQRYLAGDIVPPVALIEGWQSQTYNKSWPNSVLISAELYKTLGHTPQFYQSLLFWQTLLRYRAVFHIRKNKKFPFFYAYS